MIFWWNFRKVLDFPMTRSKLRGRRLASNQSRWAARGGCGQQSLDRAKLPLGSPGRECFTTTVPPLPPIDSSIPPRMRGGRRGCPPAPARARGGGPGAAPVWRGVPSSSILPCWQYSPGNDLISRYLRKPGNERRDVAVEEQTSQNRGELADDFPTFSNGNPAGREVPGS